MRNLIALFALAASVNAFAADTDSHQVTVEVMPINELALDGGDVYLLINTATAGEDPDPATDASASLRWTTNESNKKIVVATDNAAPKFRLFVEAGGVSGGSGAGQLELSTAPQDFVSGISRRSVRRSVQRPLTEVWNGCPTLGGRKGKRRFCDARELARRL